MVPAASALMILQVEDFVAVPRKQLNQDCSINTVVKKIYPLKNYFKQKQEGGILWG